MKPAEWYESWREPEEFYRAADENLDVFFWAGDTLPKYLRDAYVVGGFARIWEDNRGPCHVRLVPEKELFPDGELKTEAGVLHLEATMADEKDRPILKRLHELRDMYQRGEAPPLADVEKKRRIAREAIPRVCRQKAGKHYAGRGPISLVIYVNSGPVLSAEEMARLTEPWKDDFEAIYLYCGTEVVIAWPETRVLKGNEPL